jgi:hypothetical protein
MEQRLDAMLRAVQTVPALERRVCERARTGIAGTGQVGKGLIAQDAAGEGARVPSRRALALRYCNVGEGLLEKFFGARNRLGISRVVRR